MQNQFSQFRHRFLAQFVELRKKMNFERFPRLKRSNGLLTSLPRPFAAINSHIGHFEVLPKEILFLIFEKLTLPEVRQF